MFHTTDQTDLVGNPIDDVIGSVIKYAAITAAAELRVFETLRGGAASAVDLAAALDLDAGAVRILADAVTATGYLHKDGDRYSLGEVALRWLDPASSHDFTPALRWAYELTNVMWDLPAAVRDGKPGRSLWQRWADKPSAGEDFANYMKVKSTLTLDAILAAAPVPDGARQLLDLGGSHGLHSIGFAKQHPQLSATIMDLPEALAGTQRAIDAADLDGRVRTRSGNFLDDDLGQGFDLVLLFEIVHNHTPSENADLIRRAAAALNPGGRILVLEDLAGATPDEHNAAFSLAMFACSGDRTYSFDEIDEWFAAAGLADASVIALPSSVSLVTAVKP